MNQRRGITDRLHFLIKCAGAIALLNYFLFYRFEFNTLWFLCALLVAVGAPLLYVWFTTLLGRGANTTVGRPFVRGYPAEKYLLATEDGVFLLPLLFLGINVYTALIAASLYAIYRYRRQPLSYTIMLGLAYFVMAIWVLPQGLWMVVFGHALAALTLDKFFPPWVLAGLPENRQPKATS